MIKQSSSRLITSFKFSDETPVMKLTIKIGLNKIYLHLMSNHQIKSFLLAEFCRVAMK